MCLDRDSCDSCLDVVGRHQRTRGGEELSKDIDSTRQVPWTLSTHGHTDLQWLFSMDVVLCSALASSIPGGPIQSMIYSSSCTVGLSRLTDFIPSHLACPDQQDRPVRVPFTLYAYLGQRVVFHHESQSL